MAWPQELNALKGVRRKCRREYWLAGLLFLIGVGLAGFAVLTFATAPFPALAMAVAHQPGGMRPGRFLFRGGLHLNCPTP